MKRLIAALAACVASATVFAPSAGAGSYDVYACGGPAGAAQNSFSAAADSLMSAYSSCPSTGYAGTGIVTKSTSSGGTAKHLAGAYQVFEAPAGAVLDSVTFHVGALRFNRHWTVGIVAYDDDFNVGHLPYGCYAFGPGCDLGANVFYGPVTAALHGRRHFRFESRCGSTSGCDVSYSGGVPGNRALFSMSNVTVRVVDSSPPSVVPRFGALWQSGWHRGLQEAWSDYTDNVGIMASRLFVDGRLSAEQDYRSPTWPSGVRCDYTFRRPCHNIAPGGLALDTTGLGDGNHTIRVEATDAAGNNGGQTRTIAVDNSAPAKPAALAVTGGEGWRRSNGFAAAWAPPPGQVAPIAKAHYRLCRHGTADCSEGQRAADGIDQLTGLTTPAPGDYTLRVWLEDAAGNADPQHASDPVHLRFDDRAPAAVFQGLDGEDPLLVRAELSDGESGVAGAAIEMRALGARDWRGLDTVLDGAGASARIDDLDLPDGTYELRLHAGDHAGNQTISGLLGDGSPMRVRLPLRGALRIGVEAAGIARARTCKKVRRPGSRKKRRRCARPVIETVTSDGRAELKGRVELGGVPVVGAAVGVSERLRSGGPLPRSALVLRSDERGRFNYRSTAAPSRTVTFEHAGSRLVKPARERIDLRVAARSSISVSPRLVGNGSAVRFKGRLAGGFVPAAGKLLSLEAYYRGRWRTFATPRSNAGGAWSYRYRFGATVGRVTYAFRLRIPFEAGYPFESAFSRTVRVRVRG